MRYGILGDIHGNLEALDVVLAALEKERIDQMIAVGDFVGYGADPHLCIQSIRKIKGLIAVAGNHDWAVVGKIPLTIFNALAVEAILWTREQLTAEDNAYLKDLPLVIKTEELMVVHGSLNAPERFDYILTLDQALETLKLQETKVCFIGHTHVPGIFCNGKDKPYMAGGNTCHVEDDVHTLINVGSVGQPRDKDTRAAYAVYDTGTREVKIHRISYDVNKSAKKILSAGLPPILAERLRFGQ